MLLNHSRDDDDDAAIGFDDDRSQPVASSALTGNDQAKIFQRGIPVTLRSPPAGEK